MGEGRYIFLLIETMFPHLVADPIVRYVDIEAERHKRTLDHRNLAVGIQYLIVGWCPKVMIANSIWTDAVIRCSGNWCTMAMCFQMSMAWGFV